MRASSIKLFMTVGVLTVSGIFGMAHAHANGNADFLECLANRGVTVYNQDAVLSLGEEIQQQIEAGMPLDSEVLYVTRRYGIAYDIAQDDVRCALAAKLLGN